MNLAEGELIKNRYRLISYLGRGSFGEVWLAMDEYLNMRVALKIYVSLDEKGASDFRSEYTVTYALSHPNLLHIIYFDFLDQRPFLVMPYCPTSSESLVGQMSEMEIWRFIRDVSSGLAYLHDRDIVHRDIKPDNILLNEQGDFLISDFGISVKLRNTLQRASIRTMEGSKGVAGSPAFMGPELFSHSPVPIKASDIWALGVTLFELMTEDLPFFGQGGGMVLNGAEIPDIPGAWSPSLKATVSACLAKNTWERPKAKELEKYADEVLRGVVQKAPWEKEEAITLDPVQVKKETRSKWFKVLVFTLLGAAIVGLGWFMLDSRKKPGNPEVPEAPVTVDSVTTVQESPREEPEITKQEPEKPTVTVKETSPATLPQKTEEVKQPKPDPEPKSDPLDDAVKKKDWTAIERMSKSGNSRARKVLSEHYLSVARANLSSDDMGKLEVSHNYAVKLYDLGYQDEAKEIVRTLDNMFFYDFNEKGISKPKW